ncbi:hypothetical protein PM082_015647 [Marasmius tenuissimus]|nr:hypothetical protein PM082_015647 [Marasmius tenuissimus]
MVTVTRLTIVRAKYDERSQSSAEVHTHVHVYGQESSLSPSRPSTFSSTSHTLQSSQDIPLNRTPSSSSETSSTQQSSSSRSGESTSPPNSHTAPSPQETLLNPTPTQPFSDSDSLQKTKAKEETQTRSERYESLLLRCKLGFPLWTPSPRGTPDEEYTLDIGDVGVLTHGLPFNTIFNITQPGNSPANRDGIPAGVDPPYILGSRAITVNKGHPSEATLIQPQDAVPKQALQASKESSVFTFHLSKSGGALLMLPQGGTRHTLVVTTEFRKRVRHHWQDWYEFAKDKVDIEEGQALYLVTGFERCSTWAMAVWDSISSYKDDELDSLELTVVKSTGACSWAYPPARCSTQSLSSLAANGDSVPFQNQETVFIRGFRIDRSDGSTSLQLPTLLSAPGQEKDRNSDSDSSSRGSGSRDRPAGSGSSPNSSISSHPSFYGGGRSGPSGPQSDSLGPLVDEARILELELDLNDQDLFNDNDDSITHPCHIINKFAFLLISKTKPALLDAGCAALSHDEDWISVVEDSDEELPSNVEIIRRICSKFKFTIDGDVIYTASMTDSDKILLEKSETTTLQIQGSVLSVKAMVVFAAIGEHDHVTTVSPITDVSVSQPSTNEGGCDSTHTSPQMVPAAPISPHGIFTSQGMIKGHPGPSQTIEGHDEEPQEECATLRPVKPESLSADQLVLASNEGDIRYAQVPNIRVEDGHWGGSSSTLPNGLFYEDHRIVRPSSVLDALFLTSQPTSGAFHQREPGFKFDIETECDDSLSSTNISPCSTLVDLDYVQAPKASPT